MKNIKKVSKLPLVVEPNTIYYSRLTREIILTTSRGKEKFQALYLPKDVDAFSVAKYYPLYATEALAKANSPTGSVVAYGESELGPAPEGITYPVYMPAGLSVKYLGDYIDPAGDDDGDGVLNFRDPDFVGLDALIDAGYKGVDPYTTPSNVTLNVKDYLDNPDSGTYNDTESEIVVSVAVRGLMIGPNGEKKFFFGPGAAIIPPGYVLFQDEGATGSPLPAPVPAYTGDPFLTQGLTPSSLSSADYNGTDPFTTSNNVDVNIKDYLSNPSGGSLNDTGSEVVVSVQNSGIIVGPNGEIKVFLGAGAAVVPDGWVLFEDIGSTDSPLPQPSPAYTGDPFSTTGGDVNITDYISNPDAGSFNGTGGPIEIHSLQSGVIVCDDGSVTLVPPGIITLNDSCTFFKDTGNTGYPLPDLTPAYTADPITVNSQDINVKDYLDDPNSGYKNTTGSPLDIKINTKSIVIKPDGTVVTYNPPAVITLGVDDILISDKEDKLSKVSVKVNIEDYLDQPSSGSVNTTGTDITINTTRPGILVGPNGEIKYFLPGDITVPKGWVIFEELSGKTTPLPWSGYTGEDPFTTSQGVDVNIKDHLENPDGGSINNTSQDIEIDVTEKCILVLPDGTVTEVGPGVITMTPGSVLFSEESKLVKKAVSAGLIDPPLPPSATSATSKQWFETSNGDLILRTAVYDSSDPAVRLWEGNAEGDYIPLDVPVSSTTDDAQYFEITTDSDVTPRSSNTTLSESPAEVTASNGTQQSAPASPAKGTAYYVYGDDGVNGEGYYYPVYLADTGLSTNHTHSIGSVTYYMEDSDSNHAESSMPANNTLSIAPNTSLPVPPKFNVGDTTTYYGVTVYITEAINSEDKYGISYSSATSPTNSYISESLLSTDINGNPITGSWTPLYSVGDTATLNGNSVTISSVNTNYLYDVADSSGNTISGVHETLLS